MAATRTGGRSRSGKQRWFYWHSVTGILGGLLLFAICWSGAFATLSHEWDWLANPQLRVTPSAGETRDFDAIIAAVALRYPDAEIIGAAKPPHPRFAADVLIRSSADQVRHVYVDPWSLDITGSTSFLNIQRYFRDYHRRFFGLAGAGFYLVCFFSLPLLFSLVTGLLFYKRWWSRFFEFRLGRSPRAVFSNLHKLVGLWSLWFVVIIAITGGWYLFERLRSDIGDGTFAYADSLSTAVVELPALDTEPESRLPVTELLRRAREARPELDIQAVASDRGGYFYVQGQAGHLLVRDRANKLYLHPVTGEVVHNQHGDGVGAYWRWSHTADPLHFGNFGGLLTKIIWFVFGLFLAGLTLTGTLLHLARLQRKVSRRPIHPGSLGACAAGALIVVATLPLPFLFLDRFGPLVDGVRQAPEIPAGVLAFVAAWALLTAAITALWLLWLKRALDKGGKTSQPVPGCALPN